MGKSSCGNQSQRRLLEYLRRFLSLFVCGVLTGGAACSEAVHRALPVHVLPRQERRERRALRGRRGHLLHPHQWSARLRAPVSLARLGMGWEITPGVTGMLGGHSLGVNQLNVDLSSPAFQRVGCEAQEPEAPQPGKAALQRTQGKHAAALQVAFFLMENCLLTVCLEKPVKLLFSHH